MNDENLTASQWQAIAEKLDEYLTTICISQNLCDKCQLSLVCKEAKSWIDQAKKELGYE